MFKLIYKRVQRFFFVLILKYLPPCRDLIDTASASLDRKLTWRESIVLKLHLIPCKPCVRFIEQSKFLRRVEQDFDRRSDEEFAGASLSPEARERLKTLLNDLPGAAS